MTAGAHLRGTTLAEARRFTRWKIEDADMKLAQRRIDQTERDRIVAKAWADLEAVHPEGREPTTT